jgi:hypothetical protein
MTPHAHLMHLEVRLRTLRRKADLKALEAFLAAPEFDQYWAGLRGDGRRRASAAKLIAETRTACLPKKPLITTPGDKTPKWNAAKIAALRAAWERWGNDEAVARELEITKGAAKCARVRYIGTIVALSTLRVAQAA